MVGGECKERAVFNYRHRENRRARVQLLDAPLFATDIVMVGARKVYIQRRDHGYQVPSSYDFSLLARLAGSSQTRYRHAAHFWTFVQAIGWANKNANTIQEDTHA